MKTQGGLVQAYIGNGKGKTTAAFGLATRALGQGLNVGILQFLKKGHFGEVSALSDNYPEYKFLLKQFGSGRFVDPKNPTINDIHGAKEGLCHARELLGEAYYDILILDEILDTLQLELLTEGALTELLEARPYSVELILTGRELPERLAMRTHLISRIDNIKHPFDDGLSARRGIEF